MTGSVLHMLEIRLSMNISFGRASDQLPSRFDNRTVESTSNHLLYPALFVE